MKYTTKKMVMYEDLNLNSTLFGGRALEWIDEQAAIYALEELQFPANIVTKYISRINFMAPARLGDIIEIGMDTVKIGTTSITVACMLRNKNTKKEILHIEEIVFVNVDAEGKPMPHNIKPLPDLETWMIPIHPTSTITE